MGANSGGMRRVRFKTEYGNTRTGTWNDDGIHFGDQIYNPDEVDILPPADPSKIICVGINFEDHMEEVGMNPEILYDKIDTGEINPVPVIFIKGPNAIAAHQDVIRVPENKDRIDHELELAIIIGEQCKDVSADKALDKVAGYSCGNDISNRDDGLFNLDGRWIDFFRGKAFDNAAPVGPVMVPPDSIPGNADMELRVNGEVRQKTTMDKMIFGVPEIIEEITKFVTLEPGDIILGGTPGNVAEEFSEIKPLKNDDIVEIEIEGIGVLSNELKMES